MISEIYKERYFTAFYRVFKNPVKDPVKSQNPAKFSTKARGDFLSQTCEKITPRTIDKLT